MRFTCAVLTLGWLACAQSSTPSGGGSARDAAPAERDARADDPREPDARAETEAGAAASGGPTCSAQTRPGDVCNAPADQQCSVLHCGARGQLECRGGQWTLDQLSWQGTSSPWDFACAPADEGVGSFCRAQVQCCGQPVEQATGCPIEGGCQLCPASEPQEGAPCTLPPACDGQPAPRVIDCYYQCCCYGQATWAQCDGTRWHMNTLCTPK